MKWVTTKHVDLHNLSVHRREVVDRCRKMEHLVYDAEEKGYYDIENPFVRRNIAIFHLYCSGTHTYSQIVKISGLRTVRQVNQIIDKVFVETLGNEWKILNDNISPGGLKI